MGSTLPKAIIYLVKHAKAKYGLRAKHTTIKRTGSSKSLMFRLVSSRKVTYKLYSV